MNDRDAPFPTDALRLPRTPPPAATADSVVIESARPAEPRARHDGVEQAGVTVGPYHLLEQIGEGGMGVVFMAEQLHPVRRRVALKVIRPSLDSRQVVARFEAERQALALMDHPNIAKVFDGGAAPSGRPYFVMELVRGLPITDYCDQHRLTPRERLALFVRVCGAVQHAHQKGVIHRDLKPSNVLVTIADDGTPLPKVIDFGVAKATSDRRLTDRTLFTEFRQLVGTPLYMSPEQAEMSPLLDVDTRSDVYSLGILLYELLTGTTPFDGRRVAAAAYAEVLRIIREEDPPAPSTRLSGLGATLPLVSERRATNPRRLGQLLRGELDWIVMRALEKDRARRYDTANSLARDVERYLADEPVEACPPSRVYRLWKAVRRHKHALGTAGVLLLVLTGVATFGVVQASRARRASADAVRERDNAQREADKQQAVNSFLNDMLSAADPLDRQFTGRDLTVLEIVDRAATRLQDGTLQNQPDVEMSLRSTIAGVYRSLDKMDRTESHLRDAIRIGTSAFGPDDPRVVEAEIQLAWHLVWLSPAEAETLARHAFSVYQNQYGPEDQRTAGAMAALAVVRTVRGNHREAEDLLRRSTDVRRRAGGERTVNQATEYDLLAQALARQGQYEEAERCYGAAIGIKRELFGEAHFQTLSSEGHLADFLRDRGRTGEAVQLRRRIVAIGRKLYPGSFIHGGELSNLAKLLDLEGNLAEAESLYREGLEIRRKLLPVEHGGMLSATLKLADILKRAGKAAEAEALWRHYAEELHRAEAAFRQALATQGPATTSAALELKRGLAAALTRRVSLASRVGEGEDQVIAILREALTLREASFARGAEEIFNTRLSLSKRLARRGQPEAAETILMSCVEDIRAERRAAAASGLQAPPPPAARVAVLQGHLVTLYQNWGKHDKVAELRASGLFGAAWVDPGPGRGHHQPPADAQLTE